MLPKNVIYYGIQEDQPEVLTLRAGPLTLKYQRGEISNIFYKKIEVVQRIYANVRDRNWGTVPSKIISETIEKKTDSFLISFDIESMQDEIKFLWHAEINGDSTGNIEFSFCGEAKSTFMTCRIGFCILHPLKTCLGRHCFVNNNNGDEKLGIFPELIAPVKSPHS